MLAIVISYLNPSIQHPKIQIYNIIVHKEDYGCLIPATACLKAEDMSR